MKKTDTMYKTFALICFLGFGAMASAQGIIRKAQTALNVDTIGCGSHEYTKTVDEMAPGYSAYSDVFLEKLSKVKSHQKSNPSFTVPVVFHVVYNNDEENVPDSVIEDQIRILNESFRRTTADTTSMRADFKDIVGDSKIEFELAKFDPSGKPSNGITRTQTDITHFGGVLPYAAGQNAEILKWINDSLFVNYFRLADTDQGGHSPWDDRLYLNIWVGDLRIFEPKVNNFEEILYFGLATPPRDHIHWPDSLLGALKELQQGVVMHYVNIGSNNPAQFPAPYNAYNGLVNTGKMLVHEVGHYMGLRHIWGDGDCSTDDYIHDTPRSSAASQYACNTSLNTCLDTINGKDLPNMIENYMDYSGASCQNSFTKGQISVMNNVLQTYRSPLVSISNPLTASTIQVTAYPNPTYGTVYVGSEMNLKDVQIQMTNMNGRQVDFKLTKDIKGIEVTINEPSGLYFLTATTSTATYCVKVLKL